MAMQVMSPPVTQKDLLYRDIRERLGMPEPPGYTPNMPAPDKGVRRIARLLAAGLAAPQQYGSGLLGGLGAGFMGATSAADAEQQMVEDARRQDYEAKRQYWADMLGQNRFLEDVRHNQAVEGAQKMPSVPEWRAKVDALMKANPGLSEKDALDIILNTGQGADAKASAARAGKTLSADDQALYGAYRKKYNLPDNEDTLSRFSYDLRTGNFAPAPGYDVPAGGPFGTTVYQRPDGTIVYQWEQGATPVMLPPRKRPMVPGWIEPVAPGPVPLGGIKAVPSHKPRPALGSILGK